MSGFFATFLDSKNPGFAVRPPDRHRMLALRRLCSPINERWGAGIIVQDTVVVLR